ncbi:hypothetical protein FQR65_LT20877 [Abscondita terminalis]|nr:hypothetical protein FQR65_LT20877 [Abscondita terminalis]
MVACVSRLWARCFAGLAFHGPGLRPGQSRSIARSSRSSAARARDFERRPAFKVGDGPQEHRRGAADEGLLEVQVAEAPSCTIGAAPCRAVEISAPTASYLGALGVATTPEVLQEEGIFPRRNAWADSASIPSCATRSRSPEIPSSSAKGLCLPGDDGAAPREEKGFEFLKSCHKEQQPVHSPALLRVKRRGRSKRQGAPIEPRPFARHRNSRTARSSIIKGGKIRSGANSSIFTLSPDCPEHQCEAKSTRSRRTRMRCSRRMRRNFAEMKLIDYDTPRWGSPPSGRRLCSRSSTPRSQGAAALSHPRHPGLCSAAAAFSCY